MVYYFPVLGAVALAFGTIFERFILKKKHVGIQAYQVLSFLCITIAMIPLVYFFWKAEPDAFLVKNLIIFALVIAFSIVANIFVFYSVKGEKINNLEPARVLEPLFVILLAIVFSFFIDDLYDGNLKIIIPAIIAGVALVATHIKKDHLRFNRYFVAAIFGSFFFAMELVISRLILDFYSPISFYFLRSFFVFLVSWIIFMPKFEKIDRISKVEIFFVGVIWVAYRVVTYYGYLHAGVIFTTLILMLAPVLIYAFARLFLREKMSWKNFAAAIVIVSSVAYATFGQ